MQTHILTNVFLILLFFVEPEQSTWQDLIDKVTRGKAILVAFARNLPNKKNDLANFIIDLEMRKDASLK